MTAPVDLPRIAAALRRLDAHVSEHPELTGDAARERCAEWLAGEPPDDTRDAVEREERGDVEPISSVERRQKRPASRGD
jgi:hypothetical protein